MSPAGEAAAAPGTAAPARSNAHATGDLPVRSEPRTRTLCPTGSRGPSVQAAHPAHTFETGSGCARPVDEHATPTARRPAADSDSARMMDLVERAQAGEADAFGRLYDQYSDTVYRYIYYRVGGKATAEDLTSETFLRALRRIGTFTWQGRDFGAWLVTIARNLVADHFKSSRFRLEVTTGEMLDANEVERSPEDSVLEPLSNAALLDAVRRLNPQQQECVTLRFLQGLSVAETARVMGKNEGAIKTLQYRAVRTLARLLK
ncbi:ECF subfamily RNA polymerase sigma factor, BldN family [Streptomyces sp. NPDC001083]|uniref:ECF subfamily RNA polymerase sigma factor, BldN family n=2 Tax=unclassified Streptomyces TaxID=2593676 RepID=UPI003695C333